MTNPYHDAEGKFCSKTEMWDSCTQLAAAGKMDEYFKLRTEYEQTENYFKKYGQVSDLKMLRILHDEAFKAHHYSEAFALSDKIKSHPENIKKEKDTELLEEAGLVEGVNSISLDYDKEIPLEANYMTIWPSQIAEADNAKYEFTRDENEKVISFEISRINAEFGPPTAKSLIVRGG